MALIKKKTAKGITAEYWQIYKNDYDKDTNTTLSRMRCYVNKEIRQESIKNYVNDYDYIVRRSFDGDLSVIETYSKWKEPIMVDVLDESREYVLDESGNKIQEDTNFFSDATDDI